ncbi:MAG: hypothetical protein HC799_01635 [Limnothrix sp. RL_2_0]|nr:hypothetical protein [Limnothrix sp. RL_2_0]
MSQSPSVTPTIPMIHQALGSLELDLEAELRRYRRHRSTQPSPQQQGSPVNESPWPVATPEPQPIETKVKGVDPISYGAVSLPTPENPAARSSGVEQVLQQLQSPPSASAPEKLLNLDNHDPLPQDYLESSEELLKTLERDVPINETTPPKQRWTPLKIAAVAASVTGVCLLLAAVLLPNVLNPAADTDVTTLTETEGIEPGGEGLGSEPTTVNLAAEEFVNLSLDNLSVVDPDDEAIAPPAASPTPATTTPSEATSVPQIAPLSTPTGQNNLASAILPPSLRPQPVTPFPVTPQIAAANAAASELMVTPDGLKVGYYYVIFRNTSPRSLGKAREFVKDAFVRTFPVGRAIQMAEVSTEAPAKALVAKFNGEKIAAEIYHHQLSPASQR